MLWDEITSSSNINFMVDKFNSDLLCLFDKHTPFVNKRVTKGPSPWLSEYILHLKNKEGLLLGLPKDLNLLKTSTFTNVLEI